MHSLDSPDSVELLARYGRVDPADESVIGAAAMAVLDAPDLDRASKRRSGRARRVLVGAASVVAAAALAVTGLSLATGTAKAPSPVAQRQGNPGSGTTLARLASAVLASPAPAGNATLVIRSEVINGAAQILGADLFTDSGKYYFAPTEAGLPAQIAAGNDLGGGTFAREVAAATQAATGNLTTAAEEMESAPSPTTAAPPQGSMLADNWLWEDSLQALISGAGNPAVRAGVMRLISLMPEVTVTDTTANGEPAVQIMAAFPSPKCTKSDRLAEIKKACGPPVGSGVQEELTIDATTGIPIAFQGGAVGEPPVGQPLTYQVSRVTLAEVAQGRFVAESTKSAAGA